MEDVKMSSQLTATDGEQKAADGKKGRKERKPKVPLTPEQKRKRAKKALVITAVVILIIALVIGTLALVTYTGNIALLDMAQSFDTVDYNGQQLTPVMDEDGHWTFTTDKVFKVVQLTDIHIGAGFASQKKDSWAMNAVAAMVSAEKPDLVVVTGDIAYPVPFQSGTFNNLSAAKIFSRMMEKLGVYWTFAFGNHDTEAYSYYTRKEICDWYEAQNYKYCIFQKGFASDENGYGNQIIKIKNTSGKVTQAITVFDSHSYTANDYFGALWKYDNIHQEQIDWYEREMQKISAANGDNKPVKNLMFFHIPLREYRDAWKLYSENNFQNVTGPESVELVYGRLGEENKKNSVGEQTYGIYCGIYHDKVFDTGARNGLQGIFTGHDHYNNFSLLYHKEVKDANGNPVEYDPIRLTYGMSIDYLAYMGIYKEGAQRGCTLIYVNGEKPTSDGVTDLVDGYMYSEGKFDCVNSNYYTATDENGNLKYKSLYPKESVDIGAPYNK